MNTQWDEWYERHSQLLRDLDTQPLWWPAENITFNINKQVTFASSTTVIIIEETEVDQSCRGKFDTRHPEFIRLVNNYRISTRRMRYLTWYRGAMVRWYIEYRRLVGDVAGWPDAEKKARGWEKDFCLLNGINVNDLDKWLHQHDVDLMAIDEATSNIFMDDNDGALWQMSSLQSDADRVRAHLDLINDRLPMVADFEDDAELDYDDPSSDHNWRYDVSSWQHQHQDQWDQWDHWYQPYRQHHHVTYRYGPW